MESNLKIKTITHLIPSGTAAGTYPKRCDFGDEFKVVIGYYVVVQQPGGLLPEQIDLSFANGTVTVVDETTLKHFSVGENVPIKDRFFKEEPFIITGYVNAALTLPAATTAPLAVQYIFLLRKA